MHDPKTVEYQLDGLIVGVEVVIRDVRNSSIHVISSSMCHQMFLPLQVD